MTKALSGNRVVLVNCIGLHNITCVCISVSEYLWDRRKYGSAQSVSSRILAIGETILVQV